MSALAVTLTVEQLRSIIREEVERGRVQPEESEIMTREQVAKLLGVDPHTVTKWVHTQKLPGRSIDGKWRFRRAAVLAWLGENK